MTYREVLEKVMTFLPLTAENPDGEKTIYTPTEALEQITFLVKRVLEGSV